MPKLEKDLFRCTNCDLVPYREVKKSTSYVALVLIGRLKKDSSAVVYWSSYLGPLAKKRLPVGADSDVSEGVVATFRIDFGKSCVEVMKVCFLYLLIEFFIKAALRPGMLSIHHGVIRDLLIRNPLFERSVVFGLAIDVLVKVSRFIFFQIDDVEHFYSRLFIIKADVIQACDPIQFFF